MLALPLTRTVSLTPGMKKDEADIGAVLDVLVGLEQPVAGHVGEQQVVVVDHLDEAGLAALGGGVAAAVGVGGGHDDERVRR